MADPPHETYPSVDEPKTPRWVKVFGLIALVLVLLFAAVHLTTGGGPGNHMPSSSVTEHGVQQP